MAAHLDEQSLAAARIEVEKWAPLPQPADAITVKGALGSAHEPEFGGKAESAFVG